MCREYPFQKDDVHPARDVGHRYPGWIAAAHPPVPGLEMMPGNQSLMLACFEVEQQVGKGVFGPQTIIRLLGIRRATLRPHWAAL
jgi:hypothetical protein